MQDELDEDIVVFGVNGVGYESYNPDMTDGRDLGWLQDTPEQDVWESWGVTYRDVVILDRNNELFATFNLTDRDLGDEAHYEDLRVLLEAAEQE